VTSWPGVFSLEPVGLSSSSSAAQLAAARLKLKDGFAQALMSAEHAKPILKAYRDALVTAVPPGSRVSRAAALNEHVHLTGKVVSFRKMFGNKTEQITSFLNAAGVMELFTMSEDGIFLVRRLPPPTAAELATRGAAAHATAGRLLANLMAG
jgi:hypothetical protein